MRFETKIAVLLLDDLAVWQKDHEPARGRGPRWIPRIRAWRQPTQAS